VKKTSGLDHPILEEILFFLGVGFPRFDDPFTKVGFLGLDVSCVVVFSFASRRRSEVIRLIFVT